MMDAERCGARGRGVKRNLEPVWASQQRDLCGEGNAPGRRGIAERAGSSSLQLAGRTGDSHIQSQGRRGACEAPRRSQALGVENGMQGMI